MCVCGWPLTGQLTAWRHAIVSNESLVRIACALDDVGGLQPFINHPCSSLDFSHGRPEGKVRMAFGNQIFSPNSNPRSGHWSLQQTILLESARPC